MDTGTAIPTPPASVVPTVVPQRQPPAAPTATSQLPVATAPLQQSAHGAGNAGTSSQLTQRRSGGSVSVDVTWKNPDQPGETLEFAVVMETHSVDLDGYDLGLLAVLRNDRGQQVSASGWDAPPGGHHRSGQLVFPKTDPERKALVEPGVRFIELVVGDVAGVKERVYRWDIS